MNVLVVDDHTLVRDGLMLLLPKLDPKFTPIGAGSCEEAFALLERSRADIELILMDLGLPGMSGTEGIATMRSKYPEIPIVVLSGTQDRQTIIEAIKNGAMGFVPKSYSGDQLFGALQFILVHKGTFLPAELLLDGGTASARASPMAAGKSGLEKAISPKSLGLTERQAAVLHLVLQGKPNKAIARQLKIEDTTVRSHVTAVLRALNATTRTEAVIAAHKMRLVFDDTAR